MRIVVAAMLLLLPSCAVQDPQDQEKNALGGIRSERVFRLERTHVDAGWIPIASLKFDVEDDDPEPDFENGRGWGLRLGFGDADQNVGLSYVTTTNEVKQTGEDVDSHAGFIDFESRTFIWQDGDLRSDFIVHAGIGLAFLDFDRMFEDVAAGAGQLGARLELSVGESVGVFLAYRAFLWWEPEEMAAWGHLIQLGGGVRF